VINLDVQRQRYIMPKELEIRIRQEMRNILFLSRVEVVDANDLMPLGEQALAQVRSDKTSSPGHQNALLPEHRSRPWP